MWVKKRTKGALAQRKGNKTNRKGREFGGKRDRVVT